MFRCTRRTRTLLNHVLYNDRMQKVKSIRSTGYRGWRNAVVTNTRLRLLTYLNRRRVTSL